MMPIIFLYISETYNIQKKLFKMYVCEIFLTFCFEIILYLKNSCKNTTKKDPIYLSPLCCAVLCWSVLSDSLRPHGLYPARLLCPWGYSRQEYWSGLPCPPSGGLPNPGIEPQSLMAPSLTGRFFTTKAIWEALVAYGVFQGQHVGSNFLTRY